MPNTDCVDAWALRYPHDHLNPASRSCAWVRLHGGCDALTYECNSSCADCLVGLPSSTVPMAAGRSRRTYWPEISHVRAVLLQITSTRSSCTPLPCNPQLSEVRLYSGFRRVKVAAARILSSAFVSEHSVTNLIDDDLTTKCAHCLASAVVAYCIDVRMWLCRWVDPIILRPQGASVVELQLQVPALVTAYELVSAHDLPQCDPTSWALWGIDEQTGEELRTLASVAT